MASKGIDVRDALLESAAEEQVSKGMLPTVADNSRYIETVLHTSDMQARERKTQPRPQTTKKPGAFHQELEKRCRRHGVEMAGNWSITHKETPLVFGGPAYVEKVMGVAEKRMRARLRLIRSRPEWAAKLKRINPLALQGQLGKEKQEQAANEVRKVLAASNVAWGDWRKPPPERPLWFGGNNAK